MNLVLDAGALIAIEHDEQEVARLIAPGLRAGANLLTAAPVIAQAWRGGARQVRLARALSMVEVRPTDLAQAKAAGELLAASGTSDAVDALLALVAASGDQLLTSDPSDLQALLDHREIPATVVRV